MAQTLAHLKDLRLEELRRILPFPAGAKRVLEIGAGTGHRARAMAEYGYKVEAIEYAESTFKLLAENRVWTVIDYDGVTIPFEDKSFDVVFSSNVLEHIPHVEAFQGEILRVLRDDSVAIHLMPSSAWRFWTTLTHWVYVAQRQSARLTGKRRDQLPVQAGGRNQAPAPRRSLFQKLWWCISPPRHGEFGNAWTELHYFSTRRFVRLFERGGWRMIYVAPAGVFYTGYSVLDTRLCLRRRMALARFLGSACQIYTMKKA